MRSVSNSRKLIARAVSTVVCLALILCTALSFCFINTKPIKSSAEEKRAAETGIRFVQVAAGSDFAIGLTYNGDLYGWSLLDEDYGQSPQTAKTLGQYYTKTPRQIPVIFRNGPGSGNQRRWNNTVYHAAIDLGVSFSDATIIKEVVATSTTAAFITNNGTIYTWGVDDHDIEGYTNEPSNYLLLRNPVDDTYPNPWYMPYIINYDFYTRSSSEAIPDEYKFICPVLGNPTIAAGENNYIISFSKSGKFYTYVWGSLMYSTRMSAKSTHTTNNDYKNATDGAYSDNIRTVFTTAYTDINTQVHAVAGGYTVGINGVKTDAPSIGTTSLSLRGKNFVSSDNVLSQVGSTTSYNVARTAATQSKEYTYNSGAEDVTVTADGTSVTHYNSGDVDIYINGAVIGNYVSSLKRDGLISGVEKTAADNGDLVMGRLASGNSSKSPAIKFTSTSSARTHYINSAQADGEGTPIALNESSYSKPVYFDVSLGYDVGYGIADGILYSWGDDKFGQSGRNSDLTTYDASWSYPDKTVTTGETKVVSVAAGKQLSAKNKAFNYSVTVNGTAGSYTFDSSVMNDGTYSYITGALTESGSIIVWNGETRQTADNAQTIYYGGGAAVNKNDKFAAIYSGYGNHLFAVTTLGKLVHISYDATKATFVQDIYDDFVVAELPRKSDGKVDYGNTSGLSNPDVKVTNDGQNRIGDPVNIEYRKLTNWTKAIDKDNPVIFTVDGDGDLPELGDMVIYLDYLKVSQKTVELHENATTDEQVSDGLIYGGKRGSLVTGNEIGDVYRILDPDLGDVNFVNTTGTDGGSRSLTTEDLKLKFKLDGAEDYMTDAQIGFMFDYDVVYSKQYGVGIKIDPKQSSQELWVVVEFYVARYDSTSNFRISNEEPLESTEATITDNAMYYDYEKCAFRFKIDNTAPYRHQSDFKKVEAPEGRDGNSYIPLLDPNNEYNSVYSVAVQNVSGGVEALVEYLTGASNDVFVEKLVEKMMLADRPDDMAEGNTSFPSKSRISKGNLDYYFGSAATAEEYYSDKYQYLFEDRDADVLLLNTGAVTQSEMNSANAGAVKSERATVDIIDFDISAYSVDEKKVAALYTDFNNRYGLYNIKIADNKLSFSYDIIRFTAVGATGTLSYSDNNVSRFNTLRSGNAYEQINVAATEYSTFSAADYKPTFTRGITRNAPNAFAVFSQPSLRLKSNYKTAAGNVIYGKADATGENNTYTETLSLSVGGTYTKKLSDYVANVGAKMGTAGVTSPSSAIYFSFDNGHDKEKFDKFNDGFHDETSAGEQIVTLTEDTLTVKPTTSHPINFRVTIQRFHSSQNAATFGDNEKITIVFNFTNVSDFTIDLSGGQTSYNVDKKSSCDILGGAGSLIENLINITPVDYKSKIRINTPRSNNTKVLDVEKTGNTSFDIIPVSSGTAVVQVVASVYDKSVVITLEFSVSGLTAIKDGIELIDTSYVYINDLIGDLREANYFNPRINNYGVIYEDTEEDVSVIDDGDGGDDGESGDGESSGDGDQTVNKPAKLPKAVYFTDENGNRLDGYPSFIKEVRFTHYSNGSSNPRIAIFLDGDSRDTSGTYYMHVRYLDKSRYNSYAQAEAAGDTILETSQTVISAKRIVPGTNGEAIFTINVNCDEAVDMDLNNPDDHWYTKGINTDMTIYIPIKMLASKADLQSPETYKIFLVTSSNSAANYFNYSFDSSGKNVLIHPLYDTPEPFMINVSVRSTTAEDIQSSKMLSFRINTEGISTTLSKSQYTTIWLVAFFASFGVLFIIFLIRMIVYWRRRAKQRALIKRNQELIKMRDRVHNKASAATKEQLVRSKMKMEDPKYAKMFNEMKKDRQSAATGGVTLESMSTPQETVDGKKGKKKKKGGKKSIAELKAELEAKKAAFAQAQSGEAVSVSPYGADAPQGDFGGQGGFGGQPDFGGQGGFGGQPDFGGQGMGFDPNQNFGSPIDPFAAQDLENPIIFDIADDQGAQG